MNPSAHGGLGDKLRNEITAALKLLFKNVAVSDVHLELPFRVTAYVTDIPADIREAAFIREQPGVSMDPVSALTARRPEVQGLSLVQPEVAVAGNAACRLEPAFVQDACIDAATVSVREVLPEHLRTHARTWPIQPILKKRASTVPVSGYACRISSASAEPLSTRAGNLPVASSLHPETHAGVRFFGLPIQKKPIPPFRFPMAMRERFRQALAETGKTTPANVQLKAIFERMDVSIFGSLQPDKQGYLMCTPKPEALKSNSAKQAPLVYLVLGSRLDNQKDLKALVPAEELPDA